MKVKFVTPRKNNESEYIDAIQFILGITTANSHLTITDSYNFSAAYQFSDYPGQYLRTNEIEIKYK